MECFDLLVLFGTLSFFAPTLFVNLNLGYIHHSMSHLFCHISLDWCSLYILYHFLLMAINDYLILSYLIIQVPIWYSFLLGFDCKPGSCKWNGYSFTRGLLYSESQPSILHAVEHINQHVNFIIIHGVDEYLKSKKSLWKIEPKMYILWDILA